MWWYKKEEKLPLDFSKCKTVVEKIDVAMSDFNNMTWEQFWNLHKELLLEHKRILENENNEDR